MTSLSAERVRAALTTVKDPELGLDLVTLGLIYHIGIRGSAVTVRCTVTTPGCPLIETIVGQVRQAVLRLDGVKEVSVDLTFDPPWTPDRMSDEAREQLGLPVRQPTERY